MSAPEPTAMRFDAISRSIGRLIAVLVAFALLATMPLGTTGALAAGLPVYQSVVHATVCIENDADAIVLPAESRDEFDRVHHRPVSTFDDPLFLPEITGVAIAFSHTAPPVGHWHRLALPPPGRGPPFLA